MMPPRFNRRSSRGIALVFLLAMVVLLTVLVVLILTRATLNRQISSSSSGQQKADQLAQAGLQNLLNDLRQEIAAGSSARTSPATFISTYNSINVTFPSSSYQSTTYASTNVYIPTSNQTSVPAFAGYSATTPANDYFPNVLKRSAYNTYFFPNSTPSLYNASTFPPSNVASSLNTGTSSSLDGRSISNARWNKPMLMDFTKPGATFTPPDWVIVTRSGPKAFAAWNANLKNPADQANYAVGRYAYMIYDEGGLLDANTAGCNSVNYPGGTAAMASDFDKTSKRGRLGQADLTALPGLTQVDIDKLVQWRNATSANNSSNPAQSYFSYLFHGNFTSGSFQYNFPTTSAPVVDPSSAFMTTINGDQSFLSRQDLINFFNFNYPNAATTENQALPYLGTFSRELNAPSYCPPDPNPINSNTISTAPSPVVQKYYKYADNAELATLPVSGNPNPNRNFPSVKFAYSGTLSDGTAVTAGEPLVRRRFALSRLQLIANKIANPSDTTNDTLIHNYFGLTYDTSSGNATSGKWIYTSPDSTSVATSIKTLDQIAQLNPPREPDFFELLQAGILNGSLGKTAGRDFNTTTNLLGNSTSGSETVAYDSRTDYQIIQIGANIMDQYGVDPAPTTIEYGGSDTSTSPDLYDFYGVENLPYISKINQVIYRAYVPSGQFNPDGSGIPGTNPPSPWYYPNVSAWLQFELWNPHQSPETGPSLPLRVYAVGTATVVAFSAANLPPDTDNGNNGGNAWDAWVADPTGVGQAVAYGSRPLTSAETITIPATAYSIADNFREPQVIIPSMNPVLTVAADHLQQSTTLSVASGWDFIGLKTGDAFAPSDTAEVPPGQYTSDTSSMPGGAMDPHDAAVIAGAGGITFYLQCEYPAGSGKWRTIQKVKNCIVPCDTNTPLPSLWLKGYFEDADWRVPSHSLTSIQAASGTAINKSAYRMLPDPRTDRFGVFEGYRQETNQTDLTGPSFNETALPSTFGNATRGLFGFIWHVGRMRVPTTWNYFPYYAPISPWSAFAKAYTYNGWVDEAMTNYYGYGYPNGIWANLLSFNSKNIPSLIHSGISDFNFYNYYYADNDGIIRGGDAYYADGKDHDNNGFLDGFSAYMGSAGTQRPERPIMLNRPFRSPGELGYVHRGMPWKSLDFFTPDSADAGLLDLFCIDDEDVVAGTVDLNTRQAPVLQAILQGAVKNELATTANDPNASSTQDQNNVDPIISSGSSGDAATLASLLVKERLTATSPNGPLANRSELVTRFLAQNTASTALAAGLPSPYTEFPLNKTRSEAVVRPLAAVGNTRTWNLLIDIIAQSGRYPTSANALSQFVIEGEKRYWWHVAIDRYTGQIIDSQLEPVYE